MAEKKQVNAKGEGWKRFAVLFVIALLAVAVAMPAEGSGGSRLGYRIGAALVPALIAWFIIRNKPPGFPRAIARGASIVLLFAGFVSLDNAHDAAEKAGMTQQAADAAVFGGWTGLFLAFGLLGLFGSLFGERREKDTNAAD